MDTLIPEIAGAEEIARSMVVYRSLLLAFRLAGKRHFGEMTAFDLVVLLVLGNVVQSTLIVGSNDPLGGGLIG